MIKRLLLLIAIITSISSRAQTFPYLNASTGNENEFPVDKDTNIYMFHGNRLVKTDKNFNVIWANTYSGINSFSRLLLSKTGSIYCVATASFDIVFGKINSNGNVAWFKSASSIQYTTSTGTGSTQISCDKIFLDRNNNLIVSGGQCGSCYDNGGFIKLDTNGNVLKFKLFGQSLTGNTYMGGFSILTDSSGYYKFVGVGYAGMGPGRDLGMYYYNDNTDLFTKAERVVGVASPVCTGFGLRLITSKFTDRFYIQVTECALAGDYPSLTRLTMQGKPLWRGNFTNLHGTAYVIWGHLEESYNGDLLYKVSTPFFNSFTSAFLIINSNGAAYTPYARTMLFNYALSSPQTPIHSPRVIKSNDYYFDISGVNFPSNPLTIQKFNSSLTSIPCPSTVSVNYSSNTLSVSQMAVSSPTIVPLTSFNVPTYWTIESPATFSVNTNFCTVLNIENNELNSKLNLSPNPAHSKIVINANEKIDSLEVYDISGKLISTHSNTNEIDVSELTQGMYFLRMNLGNEIVTKKFIKE